MNNELTFNQKKNTMVFSKHTYSKISEWISLLVAGLSGVILFGLIGFILWKAIRGFQVFGIENILGTLVFDLTSGPGSQVSFWSPFFATLITTLISLLISVPLGVKTSIFIKFRVSKKYQKFLRITIETLAGIPSVVFGLFASQSLRLIVNIFNISSYSILNASIMLSFMILPTIIAMTYNALENVEDSLLNNTIALGTSKTKAIYKVHKKSARAGIIVGIILATGRAIGETMALSMLLQSENDYSSVLSSGNLYDVLASNIKTIAVVISTNMFTENSTEETKALLFTFGFILLVIIMILNLIVLRMTKTKSRKYKFLNRIIDYYSNFVTTFFGAIVSTWEYITYPFKRKFKINNYDDALVYMDKRLKEYKFKNMYSWYKKTMEIICVVICFSFLSWLLLELIIVGSQSWNSHYSTVFEYSKNTTGQAFLNTILIIIVSILVGLPLSLLTAIYINEFAKNKFAKKSIGFFLDSLGATPSILFGMFGLLFFIETLQWTSDGSKGFSLIAGALTIGIVILPTFTRAIQQALLDVPREMRLNGLALGCSTAYVVRKIVLPAAITGLVTSVIMSIGRILSETAPLYLTAGLTSSKQTSLISPGQTLTTRIYAQLSNTNIYQGLNIMYESSFLTLLLVLLLITLGYYVIPNWKKIKTDLSEHSKFIICYFKNTMFINKQKGS